MQVLNHGSRCPTRGVAIARYTRGSIEDGPGVSINRTGGFNSPTVCVMACPSNRAVMWRHPLALSRTMEARPERQFSPISRPARNRQIGCSNFRMLVKVWDAAKNVRICEGDRGERREKQPQWHLRPLRPPDAW